MRNYIKSKIKQLSGKNNFQFRKTASSASSGVLWKTKEKSYRKKCKKGKKEKKLTNYNKLVYTTVYIERVRKGKNKRENKLPREV